MNKQDLVFVGVKFMGLYLLFLGSADLVKALRSLIDWDLSPWFAIWTTFQLTAGWIMARRATWFCAWLSAHETTA